MNASICLREYQHRAAMMLAAVVSKNPKPPRAVAQEDLLRLHGMCQLLEAGAYDEAEKRAVREAYASVEKSVLDEYGLEG